MKYERLSKVVLGCALEVHKTLGPGLLESAYERCLVHELEQAKVPFASQVALPIEYKGIRLDCEYRADLIVAETILVELKSCETLLPVHEAQLLTYMKLAMMPVGLLINFNVAMLKDGIKRMVL